MTTILLALAAMLQAPYAPYVQPNPHRPAPVCTTECSDNGRTCYVDCFRRKGAPT